MRIHSRTYVYVLVHTRIYANSRIYTLKHARVIAYESRVESAKRRDARPDVKARTFPGPHQLSLNDMIIARVDDYCGDRPLPEYPAKPAVS